MGKKQKKVLLKDIARNTGFSINTVSRALSDKPDISDETKGLIRETANEMGYIVNSTASALRSGVSNIISIIIGDISNPHFSLMVKQIETYVKQMGYVLFIINTDEDEQKERDAINAALSKNVDGIIICPSPNGEENIRYLNNTHTPFVLIGRHLESIDSDYVVCDDVKGGYLATKHLLDLGHKNVLFFNGPLTVSSARERLMGYKKALEESGIGYSKERVVELPLTMDHSTDEIRRRLSKSKGCTGIVAFSDMIAWKIISVLREMQIDVPKDISVVGFDNIQSEYVFPERLTSVSTSNVTMAQKAAEMVTLKIKGSEDGPTSIVLDTSLVVRDSSAEVRKFD